MKKWLWLLTIPLLLTSCTTASQAPEIKTSVTTNTSQTQTKLLVVTSVAPLTNIVSNIAGNRLLIIGVIPEGSDSHTFEPRPSDAEILTRANLILVNGLSLETPTQKLAKASQPKNTPIYQLGDNTITEKEWLFDFSFPKEKGEPNPHLWVNPKYAKSYAKLATKELIKLDPQGKDYYNKNLEKYLQRLDELDRITREVVESIPKENRKLLTYHDSWAYWAREYGFEVIGAIQPSDFKEPSAKEIAKLIEQIKTTKVPAIFGSEVFPNKIIEQLSRETKVKTANTADDELPGKGSANAMENINPEHTYIGMMANNLRILASNLGGNPNLVDRIKTANIVGPTAQ